MAGKEGSGDAKKKNAGPGGRSAKTKQQKTGPLSLEMGPTTSDGEFRESVPPKSLVAMHRDTVESTTSITKKKGGPTGTRKKRGTKTNDLHVAWDTEPRGETATSDTEDTFTKTPQTMLLLDDDNEEQTAAPRQRKRLDRSYRQQRSEPPAQPSEKGIPLGGNVLEIQSALDQRSVSFLDNEEGGEGDEEVMERTRQEEREREQRAVELLERRIAVDGGSLKRLGEKVEIIEKENMEQKDKEAALRQQEMMEELARKEEERKAYEEVMRAQEAEYEAHLANMLRQEEERNRILLDTMQKEEMQRDLRRKFAMLRQSQNLELRQHVRLSKLKQKFTIPFRYSYFPILKVDYMNLVTNRDTAPKAETNGKGGKQKKSKKVSIKRI